LVLWELEIESGVQLAWAAPGSELESVVVLSVEMLWAGVVGENNVAIAFLCA
jgi:hypothetical protein